MGDYNTLISGIPTWIEDDSDELMTELPEIIAQAELLLFRLMPDMPCYKVATPLSGNFTASNPLITLSATPRKIRAVTYTVSGVERFLKKRAESWAKVFWPNSSQTTTAPKFYSVISPTVLRITGTPSLTSAYAVYYSKPLAALSVGSPTNWITDHAYDLLKQASLMKAAEFLRMPQAKVDYEKALTVTVEQLKEEMGWTKFNQFGAGEE